MNELNGEKKGEKMIDSEPTNVFAWPIKVIVNKCFTGFLDKTSFNG